MSDNSIEIPGDYKDMLDIVDRPSECSDCARYQKQIAKLKRAFIEADDESVRRSMKYENKILELIAELVWLKAEDSSGSQNEKMMLEQVGHQESNITLRTRSSVNGERNEH
jgi:hypothetical protein